MFLMRVNLPLLDKFFFNRQTKYALKAPKRAHLSTQDIYKGCLEKAKK